MSTPSQTEGDIARKDRAETSPESSSALGYAVFGCLIAGGVGIVKALGMDRPVDVLLCLLASVLCFGVVIHVHSRRR